MPVNSIGTAGLMPQAQFLSLTLTVALKFGRSSNGALSPDALAAFAPSWVTETGRLLNAGTSTSSKGPWAGGIVCRHQDGEAGELLAPGADDGDGES
jgi:hypothetical protein